MTNDLGRGDRREAVPPPRRDRKIRHWPGETGPECGETPFRFPQDFALTADQRVTCPRCRVALGLEPGA